MAFQWCIGSEQTVHRNVMGVLANLAELHEFRQSLLDTPGLLLSLKNSLLVRTTEEDESGQLVCSAVSQVILVVRLLVSREEFHIFGIWI